MCQSKIFPSKSLTTLKDRIYKSFKDNHHKNHFSKLSDSAKTVNVMDGKHYCYRDTKSVIIIKTPIVALISLDGASIIMIRAENCTKRYGPKIIKG